mmetsp:Transcript_52003/g.146550  ORF Transcript_52003/g.146550 Transcript_52003/m.146550 type:complete len:111 (-) Transcript_52003:111-443(-)
MWVGCNAKAAPEGIPGGGGPKGTLEVNVACASAWACSTSFLVAWWINAKKGRPHRQYTMSDAHITQLALFDSKMLSRKARAQVHRKTLPKMTKLSGGRRLEGAVTSRSKE